MQPASNIHGLEFAQTEPKSFTEVSCGTNEALSMCTISKYWFCKNCFVPYFVMHFLYLQDMQLHASLIQRVMATLCLILFCVPSPSANLLHCCKMQHVTEGRCVELV